MANYILTDSIEDGMILAEPIINKYGQTLLPSGALLNINHIRLFKTWNIRTIAVKTKDTDVENEISAEMIEFARERINKNMNWSPRNSIEKDLYNMAVLHQAKTIVNKTRDI